MTTIDLNLVIERAVRDPEFNRKLDAASAAASAGSARERHEDILAEYDLTAEEREALINKDHDALERLGATDRTMKVAMWCTGD